MYWRNLKKSTTMIVLLMKNNIAIDSVAADDSVTAVDNTNITDNTRTRQATSTGDIRFMLYGKEYELNQSDMMLTIFCTRS